MAGDPVVPLIVVPAEVDVPKVVVPKFPTFLISANF